MSTGTMEAPAAAAATCAACGTRLQENMSRANAGGRTYCSPCFNNLRAKAEKEIALQSTDVNYGMGFLGALVGGAVGSVVWWGFTVVTEIELGLVAIVIGVAAGKGAVLFTGGKRSRGLQIISALCTAVAFFYSSYLVNRTFVQQAMAENGQEVLLPLLPDPATLMNVVSINFGLFEVLFLGIAVYEAWKLPAPLKIAGAAA